MLDIGLQEIIIISVVAVLALGPEKLPGFIMDMTKMFKAVKKTLTNARDTIEAEINVEEMKKNMKTYQDSLEYTKQEIIKNSGVEEAKEEMQKIDAMMNNATEATPDALTLEADGAKIAEANKIENDSVVKAMNSDIEELEAMYQEDTKTEKVGNSEKQTSSTTNAKA